MNLYLITLYDPYDHELARIEQHATSMALALLVSEARMRGLQGAVSAQVDLVVDEPGFSCLVDESAGQAELHSVRSELHEVERPDVARAERLAAQMRAELAANPPAGEAS